MVSDVGYYVRFYLVDYVCLGLALDLSPAGSVWNSELSSALAAPNVGLCACVIPC